MLLQELDVIPESYLENLTKYRCMLIICGMEMCNYLQNIKYKFQEGMFLDSVEVKSYVELVHGAYQVNFIVFFINLEY